MRSSAYIASYDVVDDRERSKLAKVLEGFGLRVQKSLFECRLTRSGRERLLRKVEALGLKTGSFFLYDVGRDFHRTRSGVAPEEPFADTRHSFVVE